MIRATVLLATISLLAPACGDDTGAAGAGGAGGGNGGAGGDGSGPSTSTGGASTSSAGAGGEGGQGSATTGSVAATSTSTGGVPGTPCEAWAQAIETVSAEIGCPSQLTPGVCTDFDNLTACVAEADAYLECEAAGTTVDGCYCEGGGTAADDFACNPTCEDESAALAICQATQI